MKFKKLAAVTVAAVLGLGGAAIAVAGPASAHIPTEANSCSAWSVSLLSYDSGATATVTVDGVSLHTGTFGGNYTASGTYTSDASHTSHELVVDVVSADDPTGSKGYTFSYDNTATGCYTAPTPPPSTPVTIIPPTFVHATCTAPSVLTLVTEPTGVKYALLVPTDPTSTRPAAGIYPLAPGATVDISIHAIAGYTATPFDQTYTGEAAIGNQSTDSAAPCFVPPTPTACTIDNSKPGLGAINSNESGDLLPTLKADGLYFDGPTAAGQAEDTYARVTAGTADDITSAVVTYGTDSVDFPAQVVIEINPNKGTLHYATLSTNLTAAQATGTVNVLALPVWYTSKITSGPGSLSQPESYAALIANFPANTLLSAPSLHLQSNSPADSHSVVKSLVDSCESVSFVTNTTPPTTPPTTPKTPTAPNGIETGNVSPLAPYAPMFLFLGISSLIGAALILRKKVFATK